MVFVLALEWARRCFKKALDGKPCTIETQILHKNVSQCVVYENRNKKFFHFFWREKNPDNKGGLPVFFL